MTSPNNVIPSEARNLPVVMELINGKYHLCELRTLLFLAISLRDNRALCHSRICLTSSTVSDIFKTLSMR
jgi:hypothetical protein